MLRTIFSSVVVVWLMIGCAQRPAQTYDIVIYGGTSAGIVAAVQAARLGRSVVLIEPSNHLGGLTTGGLGATDIGNKEAIGGLAREFYTRIRQHYAQDKNWTRQTFDEYRSRHPSAVDGQTMWTFEPHVASKVFDQMLREANVPVVLGERLDRQRGVRLVDARGYWEGNGRSGVRHRVISGRQIGSIAMESGQRFLGRMFIDATYEGDLMAAAGVRYHVGRESNQTYGETLNGVQTGSAVHHQFVRKVDPYRVAGDASSGLLPGVWADGPGTEGEGDRRIQAYNFRMCTTDVPENRRPWDRPEAYDPLRYELLLRNFEAGDHRVPWHPVWMPNRKTDTNNNFAISTDNIGMNYDYPEGDYATRQRIIREHEIYQKGLMWTLANHPRVPPQIREEFQRLGLARDEFVETDNWPPQLYVREARRMISDYVMTEQNCLGDRTAPEPVGLAAYTMDSHNTQRYVDAAGHARNEGDVQVGGFPPYPIAYRSIVPRPDQCVNLLVPVCLSASHIAYGSIRMEPVFMVLAQSAATAAAHALEESCAVQSIDYSRLRARLLTDGQRLEWVDEHAVRLAGVVVDDARAKLSGRWVPSRSVPRYVGGGYRHNNNEGSPQVIARFEAMLPKPGRYEVRLAYTPSANRATNVPVTILHRNGSTTVTLNQQRPPQIDGITAAVGSYDFDADHPAVVVVSTEGADGYVVIDAVQFLPVADP